MKDNRQIPIRKHSQKNKTLWTPLGELLRDMQFRQVRDLVLPAGPPRQQTEKK